MSVDGEDSTTISNLSRDTGAIVCYSDRHYKNDDEARAQFPQLAAAGRIVALAAVTEPPDSPLAGDGVDTEPGNLPPGQAAASIWARIEAGHWRPVGYADLSDMQQLISNLHLIGVPTPRTPGPDRPWRVYTAHPTGIRHICGPATCGGLPINADATQWWWSSLQNPGGPDLDKDVFRDDFFPPPPVPPLPPGVDAMSVTITAKPDGNLVALAQAEAKPGEVGEVFALWTTAPGGGDGGPVWHGKPGVTPHLWVSLGTPGT